MLSIPRRFGVKLKQLVQPSSGSSFCSHCRFLSSSFSWSDFSGGIRLTATARHEVDGVVRDRGYSSSGSGSGVDSAKELNQILDEDAKEAGGGQSLTGPRVFSGIQPTGEIHLGNYFGAIRQWVRFQEEMEAGKYEQCIYSVVDLHAITIPQERDVLEKNIFQAVATLLACGIDPKKSILFLQSHVHLHTQLAWVLGCLTTMPKLGQLPQFKEKSKKMKEIPLGLYTYPVLQAADILLYNGTHVPVGEDNVQQIQFAQDIAQRFNRIHGRTFNIPKIILEDGMWCRLRSMRKPENKMSKSEPDPRSRIGLTDSPDEIMEKFKKAVTDFTSTVTYDPDGRPGVSNLILLHSLCSGESAQSICDSVKHLDTGKYKLFVAEAVVEYLKPIQMTQLLSEPGYLLDVLKLGQEKALSLCEPIWQDACFKVGISPNHSWLTKDDVDKNSAIKSAP